MDDKLKKIVPMLQTRTGPVIVYVTLQRHCQEVSDHLRRFGMESMIYHAGLPPDQREKVQMDFMESDNAIVCATIAFGMGIDKGMLIVCVQKALANLSSQLISDR